MEDRLTHFDQNGHASMVDVAGKAETQRVAVAKGSIRMNAAAFDAVKSGSVEKGDVLGVARIAGIMAAKRTTELIPLCHPLMLARVSVDFELHAETRTVDAVCTATLCGKTGVEMEALTGVSVALLTVYDMCKALDKGMVMTDIALMEKSGGKSGRYINPNL
jgi:cyclic pyranopterin phosphate synthase